MFRFLGFLFLLLAIAALVLDGLAMGDAGFELRALYTQLVEDLALQEHIDPYNTGVVAQIIAWPGVIVLGGVGLVFLILSSLFSSGN
jgi:hypothetical protein